MTPDNHIHHKEDNDYSQLKLIPLVTNYSVVIHYIRVTPLINHHFNKKDSLLTNTNLHYYNI